LAKALVDGRFDQPRTGLDDGPVGPIDADLIAGAEYPTVDP
jgi:hypothetical protein